MVTVLFTVRGIIMETRLDTIVLLAKPLKMINCREFSPLSYLSQGGQQLDLPS